MRHLDNNDLKLNQQTERRDSIDVRIDRAKSWLNRANKPGEDLDTRFLYLWVAFNAAYANDIDHHNITERKSFTRFINRLYILDQANYLFDLVWDKYYGSIDFLLQDKYVFQPFWNYQNNQKTESQWLQAYKSEQHRLATVIADKSQTDVLISIILSRMYTLRNQFVHGGCTWNSTSNRKELQICVAFLDDFVPIMINILLEHRDELWGDPCYPVVDE
jgi:hypothetical protein